MQVADSVEVRALVCQGSCSPSTRVFDACRRVDEVTGAAMIGPQLVHTPHVYVGPAGLGTGTWRCVHCRTQRVF